MGVFSRIKVKLFPSRHLAKLRWEEYQNCRQQVHHTFLDSMKEYDTTEEKKRKSALEVLIVLLERNSPIVACSKDSSPVKISIVAVDALFAEFDSRRKKQIQLFLEKANESKKSWKPYLREFDTLHGFDPDDMFPFFELKTEGSKDHDNTEQRN